MPGNIYDAQTIREEWSGDEVAIRQVHQAAFPTSAESRLVDELRRAGRLTISLVAIADEQVVGHVAFSPVTLEGGDARALACPLGLAPLAVLPPWQKLGVGSALVKAGLEQCRRLSAGYVVVLGSPAYYGRFGFSPAANWNLSDDYQGGPAFQAIELVAGAIPPQGGRIRYAPEFALFESEN
ncbi:MAG: GNAT family N-acetyltransferase [Pirellulales bacterium]